MIAMHLSRRPTARTVAALPFALAAALLLAACGSNGGSASQSPASASASLPAAGGASGSTRAGADATDVSGDDHEDNDDGEDGGVVIAGGDVSVNGSVVVSGGTVQGGSTGDAVVGSGVVVTENRPLTGFHAVEVHGAGAIDVRMSDHEAVDVETDDNMLPYIHTEVVDGRLVISLQSGMSFRDVTLKVHVQAVQLDAVTGAGAADIAVDGLAGAPLSLALQGSGDARLQGTTASLTIDVDGSADVDAAGLIAEAATVRVSGSGDVELHATTSLDASIQGSGDITYHGAPPTLVTDVAGSGDIEAA
jgi:hypothetical protein